MRYKTKNIYTIFVFLYFMAQMCVRADSRDIASVSRLFKSFALSYVIFYYSLKPTFGCNKYNLYICLTIQ